MKFSLKNKKEPVKNNKFTKKQQNIALVTLVVIGIICLSIAALTENKQDNDPNLVNIPISSEDAVDENYKDIKAKFEKAGFTNITTEPVDDLITGIITKEYSVSEVSVDGSASYSKGHKENKNAEVVIKYHTFKNTTENKENSSDKEDKKEENTLGTEENPYTVENNADLAQLLTTHDENIHRVFGEKYAGKYVRFNGYVSDIHLVPKQKYRYEMTVLGGEYDPNSSSGPIFRAYDTYYGDMNHQVLYPEDNVNILCHIHKYSDDLGQMIVEIKSIERR